MEGQEVMATDYRTLKRLWYQKLEDTKFNDIELANGDLKKETDPRTMKRAFEEREDRELYFEACAAFLYAHNFESKKLKHLWELHSEGQSVRNIAELIKMRPSTVQIWIKRMRKIAGIA